MSRLLICLLTLLLFSCGTMNRYECDGYFFQPIWNNASQTYDSVRLDIDKIVDITAKNQSEAESICLEMITAELIDTVYSNYFNIKAEKCECDFVENTI